MVFWAKCITRLLTKRRAIKLSPKPQQKPSHASKFQG